jgi:hypothetical protein
VQWMPMLRSIFVGHISKMDAQWTILGLALYLGPGLGCRGANIVPEGYTCTKELVFIESTRYTRFGLNASTQ